MFINFEYNVQVPAGSPDGFQQVAPVSYNTPYAGCPTAGPGGTGTFQSGFTCFSLSPEAVNAQGLGLQGLQFDYSTPRTLSANLTMQYSLTNSLSATAAYVMTDGSSLQIGSWNQQRFADPSASRKHHAMLFHSRISGMESSYPCHAGAQHLQRPANQTRTAVRAQSHLPRCLHVLEDPLRCRRFAEWRQREWLPCTFGTGPWSVV